LISLWKVVLAVRRLGFSCEKVRIPCLAGDKLQQLSRRRALFMLKEDFMFAKGTLLLALVAALSVASVRLSPAFCTPANAPGERACEARCCAKMPCCQASRKAALPAQPMATAGSEQQNIVALPIVVSTIEVARLPVDCLAVPLPSITPASHSKTLALICIRLI
jgi:hypothetical protein